MMTIQEPETINPTILYFQITFLCIGVVFNSIGFLAIHSYKKKTNQSLILGWLTITESLNIMIALIVVILHLLKIKRSVMVFFYSTYSFASLQLMLCMYTLTTDRLICIVNPLNYKKKIKRKYIFWFLTSAFVVSLILGICIKVLKREWRIHYFTFMIILDVVYLVYSTITYFIAFIVVKKSRELFGTTPTQQKKKIGNILLVPGILISTFIIFNVIPMITVHPEVFKNKEYEAKFQISKIAAFCGFIADPLSYIILIKHYRESVKEKLRCITVKGLQNVCGLQNVGAQ